MDDQIASRCAFGAIAFSRAFVFNGGVTVYEADDDKSLKEALMKDHEFVLFMSKTIGKEYYINIVFSCVRVAISWFGVTLYDHICGEFYHRHHYSDERITSFIYANISQLEREYDGIANYDLMYAMFEMAKSICRINSRHLVRIPDGLERGLTKSARK